MFLIYLNHKAFCFLVSATDADSTAPNNEIYYTIDSNVPFIVNPVTGQVFANGIDYEATVNGLIDPFTIVAHDKGIDGAKEARAEVNIQISNVNDEAPVFDVSFSSHRKVLGKLVINK